MCRDKQSEAGGDMPALYAFNRAFMAEARKLQKPPIAMANRELVELFIGCLSESLASALLQYLGNKIFSTSSSSGKEGEEAKTERWPEDRYDLEEVSKAAIWVSNNSQGIFALLSFSHDFAKQEYTTYFGSGSKSALTQSILHGLA